MATHVFQLRTKTWLLLMTCLVCSGLTAIYSRMSVDRESFNKVQQHSRPNCSFSDQFEENLLALEHLSFPKSDKYMKDLNFDKDPTPVNSSFPVLVTGGDELYYFASQGLIKTVHKKLMPKFPGLKLIYYDLGLNPVQSSQLQKYCKCEVRTLPMSKLPEHVTNLRNYAFKPIIINLLYQEFGNVWWLDSSIRFLSDNISSAFDRLLEDKVYFITAESDRSPVPFHTLPAMFEYFKTDPCFYLHFYEIQAGYIAFRKSREANAILKKWVACALDKMCIDPPGAVFACEPDPKIMTKYLVGTCHRYDQSALNLILRHLYHEQNDYKKPNWLEISGLPVIYFPGTLPKSVMEKMEKGIIKYVVIPK